MSVAKRFLAMCMALAACLAAAVCMAPRAAAGQRFTIAYTGGIGVYPRSGPSMSSQHVGAALPEGSSVEVACELEGELVDNNTTPATKIWERLSDGTHIPNAYINSGADGWTPGVPRCDQAATTSSPSPSASPSSRYDAAASVAWAKEHYTDPARFKSNRGDCTWFVSQALWNGGMPKSDDWTDISGDLTKIPNPLDYGWRGVTLAGRYAPALRNYLVKAKLAEERQISWSDNTAAGASVGDLITYDFEGDGELDHFAIVSSLNESGFPSVTEHGKANRYWSWSEFSAPAGWFEKKYPSSRAYLLKITF